MSSASGGSGVATRVPSASGTRSRSDWAPTTGSRCWHEVWNPARQCGHVLSQAKNEPMTNWPGRIVVTSRPTSSTRPQYSCPVGLGSATGLMPR
jgi:hypothetical protein